MDQLSNFISEYLKTCETIKKLNSKTIKAYRIDLSAQNSQKEDCYFEGVFPLSCL